MTAGLVFAALMVCIFPFVGLLIGLGPARFLEALNWLCGHVALAALSLFCGGVAAGEWIATKLGWRESNVDGN